MQNEVPLTLTTLRNDPEQMAYFRMMNDSFFTLSNRKEQDICNQYTSLKRTGKNLVEL